MNHDTVLDRLIFVLGVIITISVAAALFGLFSSSSRHYTLFVFLVMTMVSLITIQRHVISQWSLNVGNKIKSTLIVMSCVMAITSSGWIWINSTRLDMIAPFFTNFDVCIGMIFAASIVVLSWLYWGSIVSICLVLSIAYFWFGHLVPISWLSHPKYDPGFIMNYISLNSTLGFYWFAQTTVDDLYFLVIYASVLFGTGTVKVMLEMGTLLGQRLKGGAAGTAVVGSGITSMIMGVAVSNVQLTGRFTIPLMKRWGWPSNMAAAIEASASTSGQVMPPVLGLVAFILATFLGVKYIDIVYASVYPAILYMTGVSAAVCVYARANDLPYMTRDIEWNSLRHTLPTFMISFVVVCYLLVNLYSASLAGLAGSLVALGMSQLQGPHRPGWKDLRSSLDDGFRMIAILAILMIAIGPIGQAFISTNLSARTTAVMIAWMPEIPLLLLAAVAVLTLVLGSPLPTPVAYLIVALSMVPLLQDMGMTGLVAHFFVFYFAVFAALSPPVAVASLAAAQISQSNLWRTSVESMKIATTTLPIPFIFAYHPILLQFPTFSPGLIAVLVVTVISQITMSLAIYGFQQHPKKLWLRSMAMIITIVIWTILIQTGSAGMSSPLIL
jgi:TRAP transporter 4TM/12TM fusion protein